MRVISGILEIRADDAVLYADGVFLKYTTGTTTTSTVTLPNNTRLVAVRAENRGGAYGFILKLSNGFVTDAHWKCRSAYKKNWYKLSYNDDYWQYAVHLIWKPFTFSGHGLDPAIVIWTEIRTPVVYCRGWSSEYCASKILFTGNLIKT